jgi:hypothetical protein
MAHHHLSNSSDIGYGEAYYAPGFGRYGFRGQPIRPIMRVSLGSPVAPVTNGYAQAQACATAKDLTLNGSLSGVADVPRGVQAVSANAGDTTQTLTFTGLDEYGETVVENVALNGTTVVFGKKAFKSISKIHISAASAGNISAGSSDVLGLPFRLNNVADSLRAYFNEIVDTSGPFVKGDATTATATTGDIRGTFDPNSACNGSAVVVWMASDPSSKETLYGIAQFGG